MIFIKVSSNVDRNILPQQTLKLIHTSDAKTQGQAQAQARARVNTRVNNLNATANANPSADERHRIFSISLRLHLRLRLHFKRVNRAMQRKGMSRVEMQTVMGTLLTKNALRKTGNHTYPSSP